MSTPPVTVSCPLCAASLPLNDQNAGSRLTCPGCAAELVLPAFVDDSLKPVVAGEPKGEEKAKPVSENPETASGESQAPRLAPEPGKPAVLPPVRDRAEAEERRRRLMEQRAMATMMGQPPAGGGGESPEGNPPPAELPADRPKTVLPRRRRVWDQSLSENIPPAGAPARPIQPLSGPKARGGAPASSEPASGEPLKEIAPIPVKGDAQFAPSALPPPRRAGSGPAGRAAAPVSPSFESAEEETEEPEEEFGGREEEPRPARGGHRLGSDNRKLVFIPLHETPPEGEGREAAPAAGPSPESLARARRLFTVALLSVLLAGIGVAVWMMKHAFEGAPADAEKVVIDELPDKKVDAALEVLGRFFGAASLEEMAKEVRHPDETLPRMRRYYASTPVLPRKIVREHGPWEEITVGEKDFLIGTVELDDLRTLDVILETPASGEPKVDWEASVNWSEIPWREFVKNPTEETVEFRVVASPADYYNHAFQDKAKDYFCFRVEDPEKFASAWAYCEKNSEAALKLHSYLRRARQRGILDRERQPYIRCVLRLRFPPDGMKSNQMLIEDFVRAGWVVP